jgi:hypothetical protein
MGSHKSHARSLHAITCYSHHMLQPEQSICRSELTAASMTSTVHGSPVGSYRRCRSDTRVLLPLPLKPTRAVSLPGRSHKLTPAKAGLSGLHFRRQDHMTTQSQRFLSHLVQLRTSSSATVPTPAGRRRHPHRQGLLRCCCTAAVLLPPCNM